MKDEDGLRFAVPSRPGLLAVPPPGPTGAPDDCEHCIKGALRPSRKIVNENENCLAKWISSDISFLYFFILLEPSLS